MKKFDKILNLILPLIAIGAILIVWAVMAKMVGSSYILPNVSETFFEFLMLFSSTKFYLAFLYTLLRSFIAFILSFVVAGILAFLAFKSKRAERVVITITSIVRALPTIAIVVPILFWTDGDDQITPVIVTMLVVMPTTYTQILNALKSIDKTVVEAGMVDGADRKRLFFKVEFPQILPSVFMTVGSGISLNFKLMVAAEVLSATIISLGNMLNLANYSAEIAKMMALVITAILFGIICEVIFKKISDRVGNWK